MDIARTVTSPLPVAPRLWGSDAFLLRYAFDPHFPEEE